MIYFVGSVPYDPNYLQHFGIPGMKWGQRRFQNEDGSLTEAGKSRYGVGDGSKKDQGGSSKTKDSTSTSYKRKTESVGTKLKNSMKPSDILYAVERSLDDVAWRTDDPKIKSYLKAGSDVVSNFRTELWFKDL